MEHDTSKTGTAGGRRWRGWVVAGGIAILALGGIGAAAAMGGEGGMGRYMMNAGMHHGAGFAGKGFGRMLDRVDATAEQEEKIWAIIDGARAEMRPLMREFRDSRETVAELLGAATIDRAAAETLRAERVAAIDAASRRLTDAVIEAAEVLTPEQRAQLVEHFKERGSHRR